MKNEPVAWMDKETGQVSRVACYDIPLYTTPQYRDLSDEDILGIGDYFDYPVTDIDDKKWFLEMIRTILKKASEK